MHADDAEWSALMDVLERHEGAVLQVIVDFFMRFTGLPSAERITNLARGRKLRVQITAADVASQGSAAVNVVNPAPGGGASNSLNFTINPPNPVPVLSALVPSVIAVGSPGFTLTLNGSNFVPGALVQLNGSPRQTTYFSSTQVYAQISAADVANIGTATITVVNPAPGGGTSNALTLAISAISNPVPTLLDLDPSSAIAGDSAFTLTVIGTKFVPGSVVLWNGSPRQTAYFGPDELRAQITAADVANQGTADISVFNPGPGGGTSNVKAFSITTLNCQTICMQSASYYAINFGRLPQGYVIIGGVNFNNPVSIQANLTDVRRVLRGGADPMQQINQQYVATQISLAALGTGVLSGAVNSSLRCYNINFDPVTLSNGAVISRMTIIRDLLAQSRLAIVENRTDDMVKIAGVLALLNGNDPTDRCR